MPWARCDHHLSFQITLETDEDVVTEIKLKYFDTVPPAVALCVLKTGFLFVASEFGNHYLYQVIYIPTIIKPSH